MNEPIEAILRQHVITDRREGTCADHGAFEQVQWSMQPASHAPMCKPFWSKCPTCDAAIQAEQDKTNPAKSQEARDRAHANRMRDCNIPERFHKSTVWNWQHGIPQQGHVWHWASDYCNAFALAIESGRSAAFFGAPGTGKTHLACGMLAHISEKGGTAWYTTVMDALSRIKDTYHRSSAETEAQVVNQLSTVDLLVIDEVGRTLDTNYESAQFFRLMDIRYRHLKPTILISNLNREKLCAYLTEPVVDRIREAGGALLSFDWASQRRTRRADPEGDS
jgi:DNA replication protein DnaC